MIPRDIHNMVTVINALNGATIASDTTTDGATIDLQNRHGVEFVLRASAYTDGTYTPVIEESDTGAFSGEENAVADADLIGTEANAAVSAANTVGQVGYKGSKRYVRLTVVSTSTTSGAHISGTALVLPNVRGTTS